MKKILLISQSQDASFVNLINSALKTLHASLTVLTGKCAGIDSDVEIIGAPKYDSMTFKSRFKTWIAFVCAAKKHLKKRIDEFDAVMFTSNPPINQALVNLARRHKKKCIYLIWDIYPDCIEKSFGKKTAPITALWRKKNRSLYQTCHSVITIGEVMKNNIQKSYPNLDVSVIPYHTDTDFIHPIDKEKNVFLQQNSLQGKKVFMYSGKMGFGHGFEEMLRVAAELQYREDICFLFIGHGTAFDFVQRQIQTEQLKNARILPYQPLEMLPFSLGSADVSFITIKKQTDGLFLPSKVYDAMASGSAILCISDGHNDVAELLSVKEIGVHVKTDSFEELKNAVLKFADDEGFLNHCKANATKLAKEYDIKCITEAYRDLFERVLID